MRTHSFFIPLIFLIFNLNLQAHVGGHGTPLKEWKLESKETSFKADFIKYEKDKVWLGDPNHRILKFDLSDFTFEDQVYILERNEMIEALNTKKARNKVNTSLSNSKPWFALIGFVLLVLSVFLFVRWKKKAHLAYGILGILVIVFVSCSNDDPSDDTTGEIDSLENDTVPANDISFLQSVFESFNGVSTSSDDTYFYIASNGIPDHNMMVGITNWQQQVPIDHGYTGDNSWAIPIQPELAENPLSTQTNLLRGAIAVAANGIPVFNPLNNRGEDANDIGELDQWGGHCGRADDYHYHLPPTHLQTTVGEGMPIAYAVDGFPIYGETSEELDEYLGKFNEDGSYQYHTIAEYPYFIASMRGEVNLDPNTTAPENQVIPQAMTQELRRALTPLAGAAITAFESTGTNSYSLTYTVDSEEYIINYGWDDNGLYTYEFVNPDGTTTIETYQR
ncbi:YHYH protein [Maribacter sp. 2307UL18-2]|uniref:YHYH protein n=1 Tax=Maribacter sp. 2307UL18-2 TaxID=3386274 RepID=UPI0039BC64FB